MIKRIWNEAPIHLLVCIFLIPGLVVSVIGIFTSTTLPILVHISCSALILPGLYLNARRVIRVARRHEPDTPVNSTRIKITTRGDGSRQFEAQRYSHVDDWRPLFRHDLDGVAYDDFVSWQQEGEVNREDGTEINAKKLIDLWLEQVERETITSTTYVKYP